MMGNLIKLFNAVSYSTFAVSAVFSIMLMVSGVTGFLNIGLAIAIALIIDICKYVFMVEGFTNKAIPTPARIIMVALAFFLLLYSIVASAGKLQNSSNQKQNIALKYSAEYQQAQEARQAQKDLYEAKKQEIQDAKNTFDESIKEYERLEVATNDLYTFRKAQVNKQRVETLSVLNAELKELGEGLLSPIDTSKIQIKEEHGYASVFKSFNKFLNSNLQPGQSPTSPEEVEANFWLGLSIVFEAITLITGFLARHLKQQAGGQSIDMDQSAGPNSLKVIRPNSQKINRENANRSLDLAQSEPKPIKKISNNINSEEVKAYIDFVLENAKKQDGELVSPGYIKISKALQFSQEKTRKIKGYLEEINFLKVDGGRTIVIGNKASLAI